MQQSNSRTVRPLLTFLGAGLLAFSAAMLGSSCNNDEPAATPPAENGSLADVHENNGTVAAYVSFIAADTAKMSLSHAYTSTGLLKLTDAVQAMATEAGFEVKADLARARECAMTITEDRYQTSHADTIRKAADMLAQAMQNLQTAKYPGLSADAAEVKSAAAAINPDVLTLDQRDAVKTFFAKASGLLQKMN